MVDDLMFDLWVVRYRVIRSLHCRLKRCLLVLVRILIFEMTKCVPRTSVSQAIHQQLSEKSQEVYMSLYLYKKYPTFVMENTKILNMKILHLNILYVFICK